ncbi:Threonine/homoserine/homoserine lactone efflux protein [Tistlia consotensis]|uniref:Threonine/homoserine/homoserine lactone efflux protein n=1 Tax=Tistlia consotensis USBA 355 TaxID=560819 RepID=A0A1Y6B720_9PROT|nr:LysE family transporter [Tistlia consotensis]SME88605.1 Threonine/homoserine/homoserine lactone efflux protein [Tistlia consotensis USBA 355]SNR25125.1 Threonine/homoserine/homoserine lactone efflux protein [Tistlia consotensis]
MSPLVVLFVKALVGGFVVAVPVGAIGALCLRRALQGLWVVGLVTGFGAAVADTILAVGAVFGLSLVTDFLWQYQEWLRLLGGLFLLVFGIRMIGQSRTLIDRVTHGAPTATAPSVKLDKAGRGLVAGFGLTIINPATLLAFVGVFAGLGLLHDRPQGLLANGMVVVGVFAGSMAWWSVLTGGVAAVRHHIPPRTVGLVNAGLGLLVAGFGVGALVSFADMTFF